MPNPPWRKVAGWSGIAFVLVFLLSELPLADSPGLSDSPAAVRSWFEANASQIAWTTVGVALAVGLLFLVFASGVRGDLAPTDAANAGMWTRLSFGSAVALVAVAAAKAGFWAALAQEPVSSVVDDGTLKAFASIEVVMLGTVLPWLLAAFLLGSSISILQARGKAHWLGWLGLGTAVVFMAGSLWLVTGDEESVLGLLTVAGYLGFLVWVVGMARRLIRTSDAGARDPEADGAALPGSS